MKYILLIRGYAAVHGLTLPIIFYEIFLCKGEPELNPQIIILIFGLLIFCGSHCMKYILLIRGYAAVHGLTLPIIFYEIILCKGEPGYSSTNNNSNI